MNLYCPILWHLKCEYSYVWEQYKLSNRHGLKSLHKNSHMVGGYTEDLAKLQNCQNKDWVLEQKLVLVCGNMVLISWIAICHIL